MYFGSRKAEIKRKFCTLESDLIGNGIGSGIGSEKKQKFNGKIGIRK